MSEVSVAAKFQKELWSYALNKRLDKLQLSESTFDIKKSQFFKEFIFELEHLFFPHSRDSVSVEVNLPEDNNINVSKNYIPKEKIFSELLDEYKNKLQKVIYFGKDYSWK